MVANINESYNANPLNLMVHNNSYSQRIRMPGYIDVELNAEFGLNAGTGTITVPANHRLAPRLMQCDHDVVPVTAEFNGWRWTGRVDSFEASGKPGRETVTATLIDDKVQLGSVLAFANTRTPLSL